MEQPCIRIAEMQCEEAEAVQGVYTIQGLDINILQYTGDAKIPASAMLSENPVEAVGTNENLTTLPRSRTVSPVICTQLAPHCMRSEFLYVEAEPLSASLEEIRGLSVLLTLRLQ